VTKPQRTINATAVAVLHRTGRFWHALAAAMDGPRPTVLATRDFPVDRTDGLRGWIGDNGVGHVICVLPASSVVCRTCTLPDAAPEQLEQALQLQAEAQLPDVAPPHRVAMAVLTAAIEDTNRSGIVVAWPESAAFEAPHVDCEMTFAPDLASLAALLNGQRPPEPMMFVDSDGGSVALAITHANGVVFRGTRADTQSAEEWSDSVGRIMAETALNVGHTGPFVEKIVRDTRDVLATANGRAAALLAPPEIIETACERIAGTPGDDATWWSTYGVAAGALLAAANDLAPLTRLQEHPHEHGPSRIKRVAEVLATPRAATWSVVACLLVLAFGPVVASGLRLGMMKLRHPDLQSRLAAVKDARAQHGIYKGLAGQSLPMTKILSDIACSTPEGIMLESVQVSRDDNSFAVIGQALPTDGLKANEVVVRMQDHLLETGIFTEIDPTWREAGKGTRGYEFEMNAKIDQAYRRFDYAGADRDFGAYTLQHRKYGRPEPSTVASSDETDAGETAVDEPVDAGQEDPARDFVATVRDEVAGGTGATGADGGRRRSVFGDGEVAGGATREGTRGQRGAGGLRDIPQPITAEQVAAMTVAEARSMLTEFARARKAARSQGDDELSDRLNKEFNMLLKRLREES
jgi:hypothetical protein